MNVIPTLSTPIFLVIRRDNIGDLVCTTPLFTALRKHFPDARIYALVNSYNKAVLENNPEINQVFWYAKAKHQAGWKGKLSAYWHRLCLIIQLRRMKFDYAILASPGFQPRSLQLARWIRPKHIIGYTENGNTQGSSIDIAIPRTVHHPMHEAEDVFRLLAPLGITGEPPAALVFPDETEVCRARDTIKIQAWESKSTIGIHISARKPSQRWPADRFAALIRKLYAEYQANFLLFWSPGDDTNPLHPGDDAKAKEIMDALPDVPILAYPTHKLGQLIAGLSLCRMVVCSDGGAMHLAAGLGKPILCFFGKSESTRWHPWGVPYVLLQPQSLDVKDVSVEDAYNGTKSLLDGC
ncbi:glycosyl transferase, family 9 [Sulfuricella sp. T08]|nr:glycosyl transferase, family 9 [Sulfuricella sp. T08]